MGIKLIGDELDQEIDGLLLDTIKNTGSERIIEFVYLIKSEICISKAVEKAIVQKINEISEDNLSENPFVLMYMLLLLKGDVNSQKRIKQKPSGHSCSPKRTMSTN